MYKKSAVSSRIQNQRCLLIEQKRKRRVFARLPHEPCLCPCAHGEIRVLDVSYTDDIVPD